MGYLYISYSRKNVDFARRLVNELETRGHTVWVDVDDLEAGDLWTKQIDSAIREAEVVITLLSPATVTNRTVRREIAIAEAARKPIIPVMVEQTPVLPALSRRQVVDATGEWEPFIDNLLRAIDASTASLSMRAVRKSAPPPLTTPPAPAYAEARAPQARRSRALIPVIILGLLLVIVIVVGLLMLPVQRGQNTGAIDPAQRLTFTAAALLPTTTRTSTPLPTETQMLIPTEEAVITSDGVPAEDDVPLTATQLAIAYMTAAAQASPTSLPPTGGGGGGGGGDFIGTIVAANVRATTSAFAATESSQLSPAEAALILGQTNSVSNLVYLTGLLAALALGVSVAGLVMSRSNAARPLPRRTGHQPAHHGGAPGQPDSVLPEKMLEDYQIFISSSEKDKDWVRMLVDDMQALDYLVWWYAKDAPGLPFGNEIRSAIYHTKIFLIVVSPDSMRSKHVEEEIRWAEIYDRPIVPVVCRPTTIEERLYGLAKGADINFIDDYKAALEFLTQAVDHYLQQRLERLHILPESSSPNQAH